MRWHPLGRRRRRPTPRLPHERFERFDRVERLARDMPEFVHLWQTPR